MTNNDIFKKLRVALQLRDDQIVEILELVNFRISKGEVGNFFRSSDHPKYVECMDQILRNFLNGLVIYLRGTKEEPKDPMKVLQVNREKIGKDSSKKESYSKENSYSKEGSFKKSPYTKSKTSTFKKTEDKPKSFKSKDPKSPLAGIKFNNGKKKNS
ncbi:DUF1456 family protein [Myroides sp. LJL116]